MSKVVHHRHPTVMPLWDSKISKAYKEKGAWESMHADLKKNAVFFTDLEGRFEYFRKNFQASEGVTLQRLRLLDILVWGERSGNRSSMEDLGTKRIAASGAPKLSRW